MNKNFLIILFILISLRIHSFKKDVNMPFIGSSFETFPFFWEMNLIYPLYNHYETAGMYPYLSESAYTRNIFFDDSYRMLFTHSSIKKTFLIEEIKKDFYYGVNLIRDFNINNILFSLKFSRENIFIDAKSLYLISENTAAYNYYNQFLIKYNIYGLLVNYDGLEKEYMIGFQDENSYMYIGYNPAKKIPIKSQVKFKGFSLILDYDYFFQTKEMHGDVLVSYAFRYERFNVVPIIAYNNGFDYYLGGLYRFFPFMSLYSNYRFDNDGKSIFEMGVKFNDKNYFIDIAAETDITSKKYALKFSSLLEYKHFDINMNVLYKDTFEISTKLQIKNSFYKGNLIPGLNLVYNKRYVYTALSAKLIDAYLFMGINWFLEEKIYTYKGGIQWYFYEN